MWSAGKGRFFERRSADSSGHFGTVGDYGLEGRQKILFVENYIDALLWFHNAAQALKQSKLQPLSAKGKVVEMAFKSNFDTILRYSVHSNARSAILVRQVLWGSSDAGQSILSVDALTNTACHCAHPKMKVLSSNLRPYSAP
jgi:hypothetical protein